MDYDYDYEYKYEYLVQNNTVIFTPYFTNKIKNYIGVISKYNNLIFSNYDSLEIVLETNNIDDYKYNKN